MNNKRAKGIKGAREAKDNAFELFVSFGPFESFQKGFTLIELLAVMFVFVAVGSILMAIIVGALRGNNKTNTINLVRSNGDYAISQMSKSIQNATALLAPTNCGSVSSPTATSAVKLSFPDGTVATYSCLDSNNNPTISSNSSALIDTTATKVTSCSFTCGQDSSSDYPIIGISFLLNSTQNSSFVDTSASGSGIQFQTSVVIRNLIR